MVRNIPSEVGTYQYIHTNNFLLHSRALVLGQHNFEEWTTDKHVIWGRLIPFNKLYHFIMGVETLVFIDVLSEPHQLHN